jgi:hypothetical protein
MDRLGQIATDVAAFSCPITWGIVFIVLGVIKGVWEAIVTGLLLLAVVWKIVQLDLAGTLDA